jgi:hypothetical protein
LTSPKSVKSRLAPLEVPALNKPSGKSEKVASKKTNDKPLSSNTQQQNNENQTKTVKKNSNEKTSSKTKNQEDGLLESEWKNDIEPVIESMNKSFKSNQFDLFCDLCDKLHKLLEQNQLYSKNSSKRSSILRQVFKYLDTDSDKIKIRVSNIILNVNIL